MPRVPVVRLDQRLQLRETRRGVGTDLTAFALERLEGAGVSVAMVETGGDAGHAPARATYQRAGVTELPVVRYFKAL